MTRKGGHTAQAGQLIERYRVCSSIDCQLAWMMHLIASIQDGKSWPCLGLGMILRSNDCAAEDIAPDTTRQSKVPVVWWWWRCVFFGTTLILKAVVPLEGCFRSTRTLYDTRRGKHDRIRSAQPEPPSIPQARWGPCRAMFKKASAVTNPKLSWPVGRYFFRGMPPIQLRKSQSYDQAFLLGFAADTYHDITKRANSLP